ncbi:FkbM family methyltransferase [Synechococcus sp. CS-1324]|uniref:FkbM family methyltransferase n=1 Tax=Synechococcus sp. CS-1324 TaxID=2847980 RepID=UPI000DB7F269|nr:FkbM family methyltransferase [Synechococcus sp. CS-1324]MCT0229472.1 FkbM family methyltransferase [Synechococcus sp. CS-1324]PZV04856.1 MAG: hypothetical protein DCF23_04905 [Cyanobium sp.]
MSFTAYGRDLEDLILWRALHDVSEGFYIEVGAGDPIAESVSCGFYARGWRGVLVEPAADVVIALSQERPEDALEPVALGASSGSLHFFDFKGTAHSCADPLIAAQRVLAGFQLRETEVRLHTLDQIFERHAEGKEIHWLKVAVEGMEADVLAGWSSLRFHPWIVVVNSLHPTSGADTHAAWEHHLIHKGYSCARFDGVNRFYVSQEHNDLAAALASPPLGLAGVQLGGRPCHPLCGGTWQEAQAELEALGRHTRAVEAELEAIRSSPWWRLSGPARHGAEVLSPLPGQLQTASRRVRGTLSRLLRRAAHSRPGRSLQHRLPLRAWAEHAGLLKPRPLPVPSPVLPTATASRYARWLVRP